MRPLLDLATRKVFISYPREYERLADEIALKLRARGYHVFYDKLSLPPGEGYDQKIERAIASSDAFVFLIGPHSVKAGSYTLTELQFAKYRWPDPSGHVIPIAVARTNLGDVPQYLKDTGIHVPSGDLPAEVAAKVDRIGTSYRALLVAGVMALFGALSGMFARLFSSSAEAYQILPGLLLGAIVGIALWFTGREKKGRAFLAALALTIAWALGQHVDNALHDAIAGGWVIVHVFSGAIFGGLAILGLMIPCRTFRQFQLLPLTVFVGSVGWSGASFLIDSGVRLGANNQVAWMMMWQAFFAAWLGYLLARKER